jgi:hypothetical protein
MLKEKTTGLNMTAKEAAKALSDMSQEDKMKLADRAIESMAKKMQKVPLGFGQMIQSMKDVRSSILETAGTPILKGVTPALAVVRDEFLKHRKDIEEWGVRAGRTVGEWAKSGASYLKEALQWIDKHWDDIANAIKSGADALMAAIKFVVEHKELVMAAFAANTAVNAYGGAKGVIQAAAPLAQGAVGAMGVGGSVATLAAVSTWAAAMWQFNKLLAETGGLMTEEQRNRLAVVEALRRENDEHDAQRAAFLKKFDAHSAMQEAVKNMAVSQQATYMKPEEGYASPGVTPQDTAFANAWGTLFNMAAEANDQNQMMLALRTLQGSQKLQEALLLAGTNVEGGLDSIYNKAIESGIKFGSLGDFKGKGLNAKAMNVNVGGGNTVHIKQEFKDNDPDRILLTFKQGLMNAAASRISAKVSSPFGHF